MVRSGFEAFARVGIDGLVPLVHHDFEMTTPAALAAEPGTYRGPEGMRRYWDSFGDGMDQVRFIAEGFEDLGDGRVLTPVRLQGRGLSTGIEVEQAVVLIWEVRDAMAYRCLIYGSVEEARKASG